MRTLLYSKFCRLATLAVLFALGPALSLKAEPEVILHAIVEAPGAWELVVGSAKVLGSLSQAKAVVKNWDKLVKKDDEKAAQAFDTIYGSTKLSTHVSRAAMRGTRLASSFYALDVTIPLSYFRVASGATALFKLIEGKAAYDEASRAEKAETEKLVLSALKTVLGGAQLASAVTGFTIPGQSIIVLAAPFAMKYLLQFTPRVSEYYFNAFFITVKDLGDISEKDFSDRGTHTYVQCHHGDTTYWGQFIDEKKEMGFFEPITGDPTSRWKHKVSDFQLNGAWLSLADRSQAGFATKKSIRAILNACKLPVIIKENKLKKGNVAELRKLFRLVSDEEITFEARDSKVGKPYPIIFLDPTLKKSS